MRRRRSRVVLAAALAAAVLCLSLPSRLPAQMARAEEGGLFLLVPVGARAIAVGQAVAAAQLGSEAVWWNPAGLARSEKREAAIHHSQTFLFTGDAMTLLIPSSLLGVAAVSINILDFGNVDRTRGPEDPTGAILPRSIVYAATYGAPIGRHVNAGITYKVLQFRIDCTGDCAEFPPVSSSTTALDFGLQYDFGAILPVTIGTSLRNMGLRLQVTDEDQADPLPTRLQFGVLYRMEGLGSEKKPMALHLTGDVVNELSFRAPSARFGADLSVQRILHLRAGYGFEEAETAGPAIGVGLVAGNLLVDVARIFESFSTGAGQAPMYLSLRYLF